MFKLSQLWNGKIKATHIMKLLIAMTIYMIFGIIVRSNYIIAIAILLFNVGCMIKARNRNILLIICFFISYCSYSLLIYYLLPGYAEITHTRYIWFAQYDGLIEKGIYVIYVFSATLFAFFPKINKPKKYSSLFYSKGNARPIMASIFTAGIFLITGWSLLTTFRTGIFPTSTIYEYMTILFILAYYHAASNKHMQRIVTALLLFNVAYVLISGDRMPAIQFAMVFYANYLECKIKKSVLIPGLIVGIIGLNALGMWRGMYQFSLSVFANSMSRLLGTMFILDTAYAAEGGGLAILLLAKDYSFVERAYKFFIYIAYIFVGARVTGRKANIVLDAVDRYGHFNGGGVLPNYGYFYLGTLGVFLLAMLVVAYFRVIAKVEDNSGGYSKCLSVYIFSTVMAWYLYSPSPLIRGVFLLSVCYLLSTKFRIDKKVTNRNMSYVSHSPTVRNI